MNQTDFHVRALDKDLDRSIALLFGDALFDDPLAMFACPDSNLRTAWLPSSFAAFLQMGHALGKVISAGDPPVGAAIFRRVLERHDTETPPSGEMHPLDERLFAQIDAAECELHNISSGPHWFLDVIGVLPSHQGQGIGSSLIQNVIAQAETDELPVFLVTWQPRNLAFYRKHGFEVACEGDGPERGPHWWGFVRPTP